LNDSIYLNNRALKKGETKDERISMCNKSGGKGKDNIFSIANLSL